MKRMNLLVAALSILTLALSIPLYAQSSYTLRPDDPGAVYFTKDFGDLGTL